MPNSIRLERGLALGSRETTTAEKGLPPDRWHGQSPSSLVVTLRSLGSRPQHGPSEGSRGIATHGTANKSEVQIQPTAPPQSPTAEFSPIPCWTLTLTLLFGVGQQLISRSGQTNPYQNVPVPLGTWIHTSLLQQLVYQSSREEMRGMDPSRLCFVVLHNSTLKSKRPVA